MPKPGRSRYSILGALTLRPLSGYDIKKFLEESTAHFWSESYGQIYPALRALEAEGLVAGERSERAGRLRRLFRLTAAGRAALVAWLGAPPRPRPPRDELLLKLFYGRHAPPAALRRQLIAYRDRQQERRRRYRAIEAGLRDRFAGHADQPYWLMTLDCGRAVAAATVDWADRTLAELDSAAVETGAAAPDPQS